MTPVNVRKVLIVTSFLNLSPACFKYLSKFNKMEKRATRVSEAQWALLIEFMEKNPNLVKARGYNNSAKGREESARQWREIADALNAEGLGTTKTPKDWSVYVSNYKSKLKKIVADIKANATATGGGPPRATSLSDMDGRFLALMGPGFGQAVPTVRVNPFPEDFQPTFNLVDPPTHSGVEHAIQAQDQEEGVSNERSRSRSPLIEIINEASEVLEVSVDSPQINSAAGAGPRVPRQTRRPRQRTRPLAPIDEARRILSQIELQRAAADAERAQALHLIGQNIGRLAAALEDYVAHVKRQS